MGRHCSYYYMKTARAILLALVWIVTLPSNAFANLSLEDIYQYYSTAQSYVNNQIVKDYMVGGYLGPIDGFSKKTDDNFSGAGECIIKCDLNGNGIPDYAIWGAGVANGMSGSVIIFFDVTNPAALLQTDPNHALVINGPEVEEVVAGDINGDGIDDLVVGDVTLADGSVWILFGKPSLPKTGTLPSTVWDTYIGCAGWSGANTREYFGKNLCILDLNNDGIKDIAVTAYGYPRITATYGVIALFWGRRTWPIRMEAATNADFVIHGTSVFNHTGAYLAKGDLNKDGIEDLIFTSYYYPGPGGGSERGKAWILYGGRTYPKEIGKRSGEILDRYYEGSYTNSFFTSIEKANGKGFAFPAVGDFNGDGNLDLIVGNARYDEGAVTVIYGPIMPDQHLFVESITKKTVILPNEFPEFISAQFGQSIKASDVDGDGCADLLIGAKGYSRYKTGSRTGEGGAFLFLGNTNPPARIPTSAAAVRFQFEPVTFLEAGLGLSQLQFNNTNYVAIGDPVRGRIVLWPLSALPRVEVANFYAEIKATEYTPDDYTFRALRSGTQPILDASPIVSTWQIVSRELTNPVPNLNFTSNLAANLKSLGTNFNVLSQWRPVLAQIESGVNEGLAVDLKYTINLLPNATARSDFVQAFKTALSSAGVSPITCTILRDAAKGYTIGNYFGRSGVPVISGDASFWGGDQVVFFDAIQKLTPSPNEASNGIVSIFGNVSASVYHLPVAYDSLNPISRYYESRKLVNVTDEAIGYDGAVRPHIVLLFKDASGNVIDRAYRLLPYEVLGMENGATYYGSGKTFVIHAENTYGSQFRRFSRNVAYESTDRSPLVIKQKLSFDTLQKVKSIEVFLADYALPGDNGMPETKPGSTTNEVQAAINAITATNSLRAMWRPAVESAHLVTDASLGKVMVVDFTMVPDKNRLKQYYADVRAALAKRYYSIPFRPEVNRDDYVPLTHPSEVGFYGGIKDYREANLVRAFNPRVQFFANSSVRYQPDKVMPGVLGPMGHWNYYWDGLDTEAFFVTDLQFQSALFPTLVDNSCPSRYETTFYCNDTQLPSVTIEFRDSNNAIVKTVTSAISLDALGQTPFAPGTSPSGGSFGRLFHYEQQTAHQYYFTPSGRDLVLGSTCAFYDHLGLAPASTKAWRFHVGTQLTDAQASNIVNITFFGNAAPPPTITSGSPLPNATSTQNYSLSLVATGGDTPHQWQIVDGTLPNGLTMSADGIISGSPEVVGTNSLTAQVIGANGASSTKTLQIIVVGAKELIIVNAVGSGSITPNYNRQMLEIGKSYSMTATATSGHAFTNWVLSTNWIGGVSTNNATVQFMLQSNLTLQVNFVDVTKPAVAITAPTVNQRLSNAVFSVTGTASDNAQLTNVAYQLNGAGWSPGSTGNSWSNWTAAVNLTPGTNILQAYATDGAGNKSPTNSVSFVYVQTDKLQVQATGWGTLIPNYSNAVLEIGKSYSMTATATSGHAFTNWVLSTNWIGGVSTNNATVQFMMQSNLTLQVNFVDVTKPAVAITAPTANARFEIPVQLLVGTAGDNYRVAGVFYQLNTNRWLSAGTTNGFTNWASTLALLAGTNTVKAYVVDPTGNISATSSVSFYSTNAFLMRLGATRAITNSGFDLEVNVSKGMNCRLEVSTNLLHWSTLTNFVSTNTTMQFGDAAATNNNQRFYRGVVP